MPDTPLAKGGLLDVATPSRSHRYRILLRGDCRRLLAGILDTALIESSRGWTSVTASVRDEAEFYGLMDRFQDLALHIVSVNELGPSVLRPATAMRGAGEP